MGEWTAAQRAELSEGPPRSGPSFCLMDPEGRIRTDISVVDSDALCHLSYPGVVR